MNNYGYFIYDDYPINRDSTITVNYSVQTGSGSVSNSVEGEVIDYASFEREGIDFSQPIFFDVQTLVTKTGVLKWKGSATVRYDNLVNPTVYAKINNNWVDVHNAAPYVFIVSENSREIILRNFSNSSIQIKLDGYGNSGQYIVNTSVELSDEDGEFSNTHTITITPSEAISGSGISLKTLNNDYDIEITVTDTDGTRTEQFTKTDDEFYSLIYDGLQSIVIEFTRVEPYSFIKVAGIQFGMVRRLEEKHIVGVPEIIEHFSITGDTLEYDTLDLKIVPNSQLNFLEGQKIKYSRTGRVFYINSVKHNPDGSTELSCYDDVSRLEGTFTGLLYNTVDGDVSTWLTKMLKGGNDDILVSGIQSVRPADFTGTIGVMSYREAARKMMLGIGGRLYREPNSTFRVKSVEHPTAQADFFNEANITSVPKKEYGDRYGKVSFLRHYYKRNTENGKSEIFNGHIDTTGQQLITWNEPYSNITFWYVTGTSAEGEDSYAEVEAPMFNVVESGPYYAIVENSYSQRISAWGFPNNESHYRLNKDVSNVPSAYKKNVFDISEATAILLFPDNDTLLNYLITISQYYITLTFKSMREANAGDYVEVKYDGQSYTGWVIVKKDECRGVYEYEVLCV